MASAYRVAAPSIRIVPWAALASCWPLPQQLLPVSATGGGRRCCALAMNSGKIIFNFVDLKNLRIFQIYIFTGRVETVNFLLKFNNEVLYGKHEHAGHLGKRPEPLVRRLQGAEKYLAGRGRAGDHRPHRPFRLRQIHLFENSQPHERPGAQCAHRGRCAAEGRGHLRPGNAAHRPAPPGGHGVPEGKPLPHEHLR